MRVRASKLFMTSLFFSSTANSVKRLTFENSVFFFFSVRQREVRAKREKYKRVRCVKTVYDVTKKNWL